MPMIIINMVKGRTDKQKEDLIRKVTMGAAKALDEPKKAIQVIINDIPQTNWGIGGIQFSKRGHTPKGNKNV